MEYARDLGYAFWPSADSIRRRLLRLRRDQLKLKAILSGQEGKVVVTKGKTSTTRQNLAARFCRRSLKICGDTTRSAELDAEIWAIFPAPCGPLTTLDAQAAIGA